MTLMVVLVVLIVVVKYTDKLASRLASLFLDSSLGESKECLSSLAPILVKCCQQFGGNDTFLENVHIKKLVPHPWKRKISVCIRERFNKKRKIKTNYLGRHTPTFPVNNLASLEATLVQNSAQPPADRLTDVGCRATSVFENQKYLFSTTYSPKKLYETKTAKQEAKI